MYIKQIIVQGFKSYKETTIIEPFSPGTNVVVGRNGSGKSNFFAAIRFVLSDAYTQMSREERQALLHEGSGSAVTSAYVEIIFDNSDERFPTGHNEVVLRRTIALKKDEYSVDRKVVTKADVVNLLEAAGFSRSNPYYIVPQGRVTALTNMKEGDRLNLLKEVAGTHVYEARRAESLKIMHETNNKREKIDELLDYIKERLSELEEEKEELRGFQDKDRERRCLEYAFYHREQVQLQEALDDIDRAKESGKDSSDELRADFVRGEKVIAKLDSDIHRVHRDMDLLNLEKGQLEEDRRETAKVRAKAELKVKGLSDGQAAQDQAMAQHTESLEQVRMEMAAKEQELAKITPEIARRKKEEEKVRKDFDTAEAQRTRLVNKQTRSSQFRNKGERDAWLRNQIEDLNLNLGNQKANRMDATEEVKKVESSIKQMEKEVADLRSRLDAYGPNRTAADEAMNGTRDVVEKLHDERKLLLRSEQKLDTLIKDARSEKDQAERELSHSMDGATSRGLATIRHLKAEKDIPGAYGTLAELLEVNDAYKLPVEQVAGTSLFHYVVDDESTATLLANTLYKKHGGRVTFMPLNQLRPRPANFPRGTDAVPILSKIQFDKKFEKAFQQVFGKTVLCANLTIAGQYARSHGVDGITAEGDTTNKRGAMTGGYIDPRKSRLDAVKNVSRWRDEFDQKVRELDGIRRQIELKNQEISRAMGDQQKALSKLRHVEQGFEPLQHELRVKSNHLANEQLQLESAAKRRDMVEQNMKDFGESISALEAELAADFKKALSAAEEAQLEELGRRVAEFRKQWNDASRKYRDLERTKQSLEIHVRHSLQPKLDQLNSLAFENSSSAGSSLKDAQRELKRFQKTTAAIEARLQETESQLDAQLEHINALEAQKAETETQQQETAARIDRHQKRAEKNLQRRAILTQQHADCTKNIRDLGVLPEEAFEKYESMELKTITSKLKRVNEALKKFKHVNKKAFEQYNSFTTQQDQLMKRRTELDQSQESIEELVAHLDQRKDEAIERTFKQVSKEFATIFEKLVPAGHGRLVIQRRADRRQQPDPADESEGEQNAAVENYTGVGISVSFNSKQFDEQQRIQQLSGGQKSLCALCLIFALQQTESSPMVIFDEVDANLDAQYRTAVASLLMSISREAGTQFICTTFRPEIVHVADKCYGVTFLNKTSSINCVPAEAALEFVEGQQKR